MTIATVHGNEFSSFLWSFFDLSYGAANKDRISVTMDAFSMSMPAIEVVNACKCFVGGKRVLDSIHLKVERGEMVALIGASGSGKSTLIRTIAGLTPIDRERTNPGEIRILGQLMQQAGRVTHEAGRLRTRVGVVFQQFNLVTRLSVLTNVLLGLLGQMPFWRGHLGLFRSTEKRRAMRALQRVGIESHALKRGSELSGGQQQRAAIARTLLQGAEVLIADEPIASLDPSSARRVMDILTDLNLREGITVLVSLHQVEYALRYCKRVVALRDGRVVFDGPSQSITPAFLGELYGAESEELFIPVFQRAEADSDPSDDALVPAKPRLNGNRHINGGATAPLDA
jgi:phosphonate transport system ATP-binding protein